MVSSPWGPEVAESYDVTSAAMFEPAVLGPTVDLLDELSEGGPALEFAIGTGRVGIPLQARGLVVKGVELSPHMADRLRTKPDAAAIEVTVGDMTDTRVPGDFRLVYLVWNTIMNVTSQDDQTAVFANAAAHLAPGGRFLVEVIVPNPAGDRARVFDMSGDHIGIDTVDDPVGQICSSHHWSVVDGRLVRFTMSFRYVWPSELDLMAQLAGLRLEHRWGSWQRAPFTADSRSHVSVWTKDGAG